MTTPITSYPLNSVEHKADPIEARPGWLDGKLYPFQSRYLEIDGNRIHYIDEGSGPLILFLHGIPAWSFLYREIIQELRGHYRCIALDLPGFGLSLAREDYGYSVVDHALVVEKFLFELDLREIVLAVHDSGGTIGLGVAGRHPDRFNGFVISNSFAWTLDDYPFVKRFLKVVGSGLFGFVNSRFNLLPRLFVRSWPFPQAVKDAYLGPWKRYKRRRAIHLLFRSLVARSDYLQHVESNLSRLRHLPALILWGKGDSTYQAGFHERFAWTFPDHQLEIVYEGNSQTGHFPQEGGGQRMQAVISDWMEKNESKREKRS